MDLREDKLALRLPIAFDSFHANLQCLKTPRPKVRSRGELIVMQALDSLSLCRCTQVNWHQSTVRR